jgi:hypothetical protein
VARASDDGGAGVVSCSISRPIRPVSTEPAMKSGVSRQRTRKAALVFTGHTSTSAQASARSAIAWSRVGAWLISLAIIGS